MILGHVRVSSWSYILLPLYWVPLLDLNSTGPVCGRIVLLFREDRELTIHYIILMVPLLYQRCGSLSVLVVQQPEINADTIFNMKWTFSKTSTTRAGINMVHVPALPTVQLSRV